MGVVLLLGCGGAGVNGANQLPVAEQSTTLGPGDVFVVNVVGEKELPTEFRVQPDGSVDYPYIGRVKVAGLEPQEVVDVLKAGLREAKILSDPQMTMFVKQYNSKRVTIIGSVSRPGSIPWTEGLRLVDAISQAGWFTQLGDSKNVLITRRTSGAKTVTVRVSVEAISEGRAADIPLQAGDTIKVDQRIF
jgi:polysaccharide export outer membrane protein